MGCLCQRKKNKQREQVEIPGAIISRGPAALALAVAKDEGENRSLVFLGNTEQVFDFDDLVRASAEVLGKGTLGTSYKANLNVGPLAVKRLKDVKISKKKFVDMIDAIGKINHENLLPLKAYYCSKAEKFLICDYMPMGSLSALLQRNRGAGKGKTPLNWETRVGIALGVARAIAHIHSQCPATFHGNIKSSNILLTTTLEARVSDYLPNYTVEHIPAAKHLEFDVGYCASEATNNGEVSQKADVYSFGVVLLELLTGKSPIFQDEFTSEKVNIRKWILSVVDNELTSEVFHLDLLQYENVEEELVRLLQIAIDCTAQDPGSRPSMAEVRRQIGKLCCASSQVCSVHIDNENY